MDQHKCVGVLYLDTKKNLSHSGNKLNVLIRNTVRSRASGVWTNCRALEPSQLDNGLLLEPAEPTMGPTLPDAVLISSIIVKTNLKEKKKTE